MPRRQKALQWHSVEVVRPPAGAVVLASSPACRVQAMRVGGRAWSMQYHVEAEPDTVADWGEVPAYRQALEATIGPAALPRLAADADAAMGGFADNAGLLYRNFMAAVGG
jgi:GMP synthase-like glutamine amidotransferase